MDDPEHQHDAVLADYVEHHAIVADAKSMDALADTADRLHALAADPASLSNVYCKFFEATADAFPRLSRELLECPPSSNSQFDVVGLGQSSSASLRVRPFR